MLGSVGYCIDKNFSNSLQLFFVFLTFLLVIVRAQHSKTQKTIATNLRKIQSLLLTHHCYSLPCVYFSTFTTVITSQHGLRLITVTGIWICIILSCILLHWICIQIA